MDRLPPDVGDLLERGEGIVDVTTAARAGVSKERLARLANAGSVARLIPGVYASTELLGGLDDWGRHVMAARALALSCGDGTLVAGWSAVGYWDLPIIGMMPGAPTVVRPKAPGVQPRRTRHGRVLVSGIPHVHRLRRGGTDVVSPAWAAVDVARTAPIGAGLVVADAVANRGHELSEVLVSMAGWFGIERARWVVEHAMGGAESPLETLGRFACLEFGLPVPGANAWVGAEGPSYRLDGLWPFHWAGFEADGAVKYDNRPDASRVVAMQTEREWYLRDIGLDLARYGSQLAIYRRVELASRFARLLERSPPRAEPIRWWKHVPGIGPVEPAPSDWPRPEPGQIILPAGWRSDLGRAS